MTCWPISAFPSNTVQSYSPPTRPTDEQGGQTPRDGVGIFANEPVIIRLIGAVLLEQNHEWRTQNRYVQVDAVAEISVPTDNSQTFNLPPKAA
jgi:hypothetical protein